MADKKPIVPMAAARYTTLDKSRNTPLERARKNSELTIPGLVPKDGQDSAAAFSQPYQSLGARCVNNLAAWLLLTQLPPDTPFARISIHEDTAKELGSALTDAKNALNKIALKAHLLVETAAMRPILMEVFRHLIVAGNALVHIALDDATPRMWRLDQYVCLRDERGRVIEIVIKEQVYPATLSEEVRVACDIKLKDDELTEKPVDLYTHVKYDRDSDELVHYQEINKKLVPESEGSSPRAQSGWMALRWQAVPGSDYGRAHVSEYIGDLMSLEDISKAIIQFAAVASRIIHMVDPNSMIDIDELNAAETGDYVTGYIDKIKALQLDKTADFSVASEVASRLELRLSHAFMLQSGTVRNAERVTAEEIRAMAQELENVLGGVYTVLSAELQLPLIRRLLYILQKNGDAPDLPDSVQPTIVTGFEALGRNHAANRLRMWISDMTNAYGEQVVAKITDPTEVGKRFADNYGIEDVDTLIKSPDQQAQETQAEQTAAITQAAVPQAVKPMIEAATAPEGTP